MINMADVRDIVLGPFGPQPVSMIGTLDPGQTKLAKQLQRMLAGGTQYSKNYLSGLTGFLKGKDPFGGPLGGEAISALKRAMSGEVSEEYFQKTVAGPATRTFREEIAPTISKQFVGPGTFWGGAKGAAVQREGLRLSDAIASARGGMAQEALVGAQGAALGYGELMSKGTSDWIQAYVAANPTYSDTIESILAYLNTPTQLAYQNPEYIPSAIKKAMKPQRPVTPYTGNIPGMMWSEGAGGYF